MTTEDAAKPGMTCQRPIGGDLSRLCGSRKFRPFVGPSGYKLRCVECGEAAKYAQCDCGHGMLGAHTRQGGCQGVMDLGEPCTCQAALR